MSTTATVPLLTELNWQDQAIKDLLKWAEIKTKDPRRLDDFQAGAKAGWNECIRTLKIQGLLKLTD